MKHHSPWWLFPVACLFLFVEPVTASPQEPDHFILHGDTVAIYQLPLNPFLRHDEDNYYWQMRRSEQLWILSSNWRGYRATWAIQDGRLVLYSLTLASRDPFGLSDLEAVERILGTRLEDELLFAEWYSGRIIVATGDLLRWDGIFDRTFTSEIIFNVERGILVSTDTVYNYLHIPGATRRLFNDNINAVFLDRIRTLDWMSLHHMECDRKYQVIIGTDGQVRKITHEFHDLVRFWQEAIELLNIQQCSSAIQSVIGDLRFDIIKWHGTPIEENIYLRLYFDTDTSTIYDLAVN